MTIKPVFPDPDRHIAAGKVRRDASDMSNAAPNPDHRANSDNAAPYIFNFTKGLPHGFNGLMTTPGDYQGFIDGTASHDPRIFAEVKPYRGTFIGEDLSHFPAPEVAYRQWESPTAGHAYVGEGPDPASLTMPPAPAAGSAEFAAEMAEVYQMALSRDLPIAAFMHPALVASLQTIDGQEPAADIRSELDAGAQKVADAAGRLAGLRWFQGHANAADTADPHERKRRRFGKADSAAGISAATMFRGEGEDGWDTPFLSQFMVMGTGTSRTDAASRATGRIGYGAQVIEQKVRVAHPHKDYMTRWADWVNVQNGLNKRRLVDTVEGGEFVPGAMRPISRLRDLATYVHDDQLYQAYLNAALILLGEGHALDVGIPYHHNSANPLSRDSQEPFALFGGPHLLTLVTEVSSRALKAVRLQKFSVHRRMRPEVGGALFHTVLTGYHPQRDLEGDMRGEPFATGDGSPEALAREQLAGTIARHNFPNPPGVEPSLYRILEDVRLHNARNNGEDGGDLDRAKWLLPMAFPEGSPMHPAYGAGHATVAGACCTLLKAFYSMVDPANPDAPAYLVQPGGTALVPDGGRDASDTGVQILGLPMAHGLTLEGELNKLIWNISNARNIAGVHFYTDYIESALLGESITLGILREQMLAYHPRETVTMTVPLLVPRKLPACLLTGRHGSKSSIGPDDTVSAVLIRSDGRLEAADATPGRA